MKGEIKFVADGKSLHGEGNMEFENRGEIFELICVADEVLGVTSNDDWIKLSMFAMLREKNQGNLEKYEMRIPKKK